MYADDTHLTLAGINSIELNLNKDLASVSDWLIPVGNKLTLNKSKTEFMLIGSRQRLRSFVHSPSLKIDGAQISQVPSTKSLVIKIDENLTWNVHIENFSKKITSGIGALKYIRPFDMRPFVPHRTLRFIYNSLVKLHFNYCNVVWGNCPKFGLRWKGNAGIGSDRCLLKPYSWVYIITTMQVDYFNLEWHSLRHHHTCQLSHQLRIENFDLTPDHAYGPCTLSDACIFTSRE